MHRGGGYALQGLTVTDGQSATIRTTPREAREPKREREKPRAKPTKAKKPPILNDKQLNHINTLANHTKRNTARI